MWAKGLFKISHSVTENRKKPSLQNLPYSHRPTGWGQTTGKKIKKQKYTESYYFMKHKEAFIIEIYWNIETKYFDSLKK